MARKISVNKSQKIREYLSQNPGARPSEVAEALREYGVSPAMVSFVSSRSRNKRSDQPGRRKTTREEAARPRAVRKKRPPRQPRPFHQVLVAAELIRISGGLEEARAALQTAARARFDR